MMSTMTQNGVHSQKACVLYGTETGNSYDLAGEIAQILERQYIFTDIQELDSVHAADLNDYDLTVFAVSTTGQGDFPSNARRFWLSLLKKKLSPVFLSQVRYALVGLCDSSYPKFNLAGRKLHKRLQQLGAQPILQPCEADEQGEDGTEGAFLNWSRLFRESITSIFPLPSDQQPIPDTQRLPSKWTLQESRANGAILHTDIAPVPTSLSQATSEVPFKVELQQNERVTPSEHWQDVRLLKLVSDNAREYLPGDALAIRPENTPQDVDDLFNILDWQAIADAPLVFHHIDPAKALSRYPDPVFEILSEVTLRKLFTYCLDIHAIPRRSFFANIAHFTDDEMQKERALEFTDAQYLDEYFDYATRPRRSILEVLQEFHTVRIPWQEAINIFPVIRPRQFSIASGGELKHGGHSFELLVAIVKYRTVIKRIRQGLCTRYLAYLPIGTKLNVTLHTEGRFYAKMSNLQQNHLLIGGGTGIAPLRSVIHETILRKPNSLESTLIFGCRNANADFFFADEWTSLSNSTSGTLRILTAFSRDQQQKIYVQDRIREDAPNISQLLLSDTGTVIVCGSSGQMPKAVRQALRDTLVMSDNFVDSDEDAEKILSILEKQGRYKQETW